MPIQLLWGFVKKRLRKMTYYKVFLIYSVGFIQKKAYKAAKKNKKARR